MNSEEYSINASGRLAILAFLVWMTGPGVIYAQFSETVISLTQSDFSSQEEPPYITDVWKFMAGDDPRWMEPAYDDSSWQQVSTRLGPSEFPFIDWGGVGWFRVYIKVDSTLVNHPLALLTGEHNGASEIYLNGKKLYSLGHISTSVEEFEAYHDQRPRPFILTDTTGHLLAVRFANLDAPEYNEYGFNAGFRLLVDDMDQTVEKRFEEATVTSWPQMFYSGILLAFTVIHFMLFVFYPGDKKNLYFALFAGFLSLLTFMVIQATYAHSPMMSIHYHRLSLIALIFTVIYAIRFAYCLLYNDTPRQFWIFLILGTGIALLTWMDEQGVGFYRDIFIVITLIEIIRVAGLSFLKRVEGLWFLAIGLASFVCGVLYTILGNLDLISSNTSLGNLYGSTLLILTMSLYLSRDFAETQKRLEHKLKEVKRLSDYTIEQERISKQKEIEHKLLEAENQRKSRELEEARTLQLSMLPKKIPNHPQWEIAVFMDTAYEVGGDYYDFATSESGVLTIALGDATGHGMKAGIIVATAKSYFHTLANNHENLGLFRRMSSGIRNMDLKTLYMSLMLLRCKGQTIKYLSAGMPPSLLYRKNSKCIEEICLKGMPLGSKVDFPYKEHQIEVHSGDTLLLMSDGLVELFNHQRELLGLDRVKECFGKTADASAETILSAMCSLMKDWTDSETREDDVTIMVLKAR